MGSFFYGIYVWIVKKRWWALLGLILVLTTLVSIVRQIEFDDDISSLIPANKETQRIQKVLKSIAFTDKIVVNIRKQSDGSIDDLTDYATDFIDSIENNQGAFIRKIQGRVDDDVLPNIMDLVYRNLPLFLEETDYEIIQRKLYKDSITKITAANYRTLISPTGIVAKKNIVKDPLGISFMALKKLQKLGYGEGFQLKNGFLLDKNEQNILLFITPRFGSNETNKNLPFSESLFAIQEALNDKYDTKVQSEYFGAALSAVSNATQIKKDIQFTVSIAMTLLVILLIVFYRKLALPFILFSPTIFGGLLAIAILCLIRTKISAISLGIGSILLGVTLDYGLHILTHLRNEYSIKSLYKEVAPSVLLSSLTTASAFLCLLFLDSQALQDLGIFAAVSVLGASVFALLFIPQVYKTKNTAAGQKTILDRWAAYNLHQNKWALSALGILFVLSIFTYKKVVFNQDITKLNYETQALLKARERMEKLTDIGSKSIYISTYGKDRQQVLQQNDSLFQRLVQLEEKGEIVSFGSIGTLAKSNSEQKQKIDTWKRFWNAQKIESLKQNLTESATDMGFKENTFDQFYTLLKSDFELLKLSDLEAIKSFSVDDYLVEDENGVTITSLIKVDDSKIESLREQFLKTPYTLLIDRQQVNETFLGNLKNDFNRLLGYSLIAVLLILFLFYRSISLTLITGVPIFLTWFLTVGIMGLFGIEFNIFNIIICSFIFGLGVDYSIFITNGLLTEYRIGEKTLVTHKTSIILSVITTIAGIGVLVFAKHPVLYTVSLVSLLGIGCALFVSFTLQPLLFRLFIGGINKRPITPRYLIHSLVSFGYFDLGGLLLSVYSWVALKLDPNGRSKKQLRLHKLTSEFMKSVLYTNPFVKKEIRNPHQETFEKPAMLIANHASFLDVVAMGMLHPKCIYLVKDHVYNSKTVGSAARLHGAYPVSLGIESGEAYLRQKLAQGFSIIAFPEGTRSTSNKMRRFHKGAFYLAEQLGLDILPVLIHGSSEVSPKNSFIIRDGSITLKILPRITTDNLDFGKNYTQRAKQIGQYFRLELRKLRDQVEGETYWHKLIFENYRHKGDSIYRAVKKDLKDKQSIYKNIIGALGEKDSIIHISSDFGQLDLLMALDAIDRKIYTYLENPEAGAILKNNYLTHQYSKITVLDSVEEALAHTANVLIVNLESFDLKLISKEKLDEIDSLIVLNENAKQAFPTSFVASAQNDNFILLKK